MKGGGRKVGGEKWEVEVAESGMWEVEGGRMKVEGGAEVDGRRWKVEGERCSEARW